MQILRAFFLIPSITYAASLTLSGNPGPLIIAKATAGKEPESTIDNSTKYTIQVSPKQTATIIASIDSPTAPHTFLKMTLEAPSQSKSIASVTLNPSPQVLVSNIQEGFHDKLSITYEYSAKVAAGIVPLSTKTVFLTVLDSQVP